MKNDQDQIETPIVEEDKPANETKQKDLLKRLKLDSKHRHHYSMMRLDHLIELVSHPGFILGITVVFALLFLITRYLGMARNHELLKTISNDLGKVLTYIITVIVTYIVTRFLDAHKK